MAAEVGLTVNHQADMLVEPGDMALGVPVSQAGASLEEDRMDPDQIPMTALLTDNTALQHGGLVDHGLTSSDIDPSLALSAHEMHHHQAHQLAMQHQAGHHMGLQELNMGAPAHHHSQHMMQATGYEQQQLGQLGLEQHQMHQLHTDDPSSHMEMHGGVTTHDEHGLRVPVPDLHLAVDYPTSGELTAQDIHLVTHPGAEGGLTAQDIQHLAQAEELRVQPHRPHNPPQATKSSRFRGVYRRKRGGRWEASIVIAGKNCRLGLHDTDVEAARAYDRVAIRKWGKDGAADKTNFPVSEYDAEENLLVEELETVVQQVRGPTGRARTRAAHPLVTQDLGPQPGSIVSGYDLAPGLPDHRLTSAGMAVPDMHQQQHQPPQADNTGHEEHIPMKRQRIDEPYVRVPVRRSSDYRGVSGHKQSGKWVAQVKARGKQVYLGFYGDQESAAAAYDQAAILLMGERAQTNFPPDNYAERWDHLRSGISIEELVVELKAEARGINAAHNQAQQRQQQTVPPAARPPKPCPSKYRGVAPDKSKKWRAQITVSAKSTVYLGLFTTEDGAARAYDRAAISKRGVEQARTNHPVEEYADELEHLLSTKFEDVVKELRARAVAEGGGGRLPRATAPSASMAEMATGHDGVPPAEPSHQQHHVNMPHVNSHHQHMQQHVDPAMLQHDAQHYQAEQQQQQHMYVPPQEMHQHHVDAHMVQQQQQQYMQQPSDQQQAGDLSQQQYLHGQPLPQQPLVQHQQMDPNTIQHHQMDANAMQQQQIDPNTMQEQQQPYMDDHVLQQQQLYDPHALQQQHHQQQVAVHALPTQQQQQQQQQQMEHQAALQEPQLQHHYGQTLVDSAMLQQQQVQQPAEQGQVDEQQYHGQHAQLPAVSLHQPHMVSNQCTDHHRLSTNIRPGIQLAALQQWIIL